VLRRRARLDWWAARTGDGRAPDNRRRLIADLALSDKQTPAEIKAVFSGARHCPAPLDDAETALADSLAGRPLDHHTDMPDCVRLEYPAWLDGPLRAAFGADLDSEMTALNLPAPVDLRANTLKGDWEDAQRALDEVLVEAEPTPLSPLGLRLAGHVRLGGVKPYRDGLVDIQDEGSQICALMTDARPGMTVIDYCAGAGGKTLALAAQMAENGAVSGRLIAADIFQGRMARMRPRLRRAGAKGVERHVLAGPNDPWLTDNAAAADRVLVDAPCTGSGTWRRHPEAKWRLTPQDLDDGTALQDEILARAAALVAPGGRLIYVTCSVLREENDDRVARFLEQTPGFEPADIDAVWAASIGGPPPDMADGVLRLSPWRTGTDGFFCAILERCL
jgi:16S rRNA (cytosine967-C5)-methyltransferase